MLIGGVIQPPSSSATKKCNNGAFPSSPSIVCKAACTTPSLSNGAVTGPSLNPTHHGKDIGFTCDAKYYLTMDGANATEPSTRTCSGGSWSDNRVAACAIKTCTKPNVAEASQGTIITGTAVVDIDKSVTYSCKTNYKLTVGGTVMSSYQRQCIEMETWASAQIMCNAPCSKPAGSAGLQIAGNDPALHGEDAVFTCETGYVMTIAEVQQAPGASYTKACASGAFSDLTKIECLAGCAMPSLANGDITGSGTHGSSITFTCRAGFTMMVNGVEEAANTRTKTCSDGSWDDSSVVLCATDPCTRPKLTNGIVVDDSQWFWAGPVVDGNTASYYCKDGYTLSVNGANSLRTDPSIPAKYLRKCLGAEVWDKTDTVECLSGCDELIWTEGTLSGQRYVVNGTERTVVAIGDTLTYSCPSSHVQLVDGVVQSSDYTTTCDGGNVWSNTGTVECMPPCTTIPTVTGGTISGPQPTPYQGSLTFTCPNVLRLNGVKHTSNSVSWTCLGDDEWSSSDTLACDSQCQTSAISNALPPFDAVTTVDSTEKVVFACVPGYRPQYVELTCVDQDQFDQNVPVCRQVCEIPEIVNGTLRSTSNEIADFVEIGGVADRVCYGWFETTDTTQAVCQTGGTFDSLHVCKPYCIVPEVKNGGFEEAEAKTLILEGSSVTPICNHGFLVSDTAASMCLNEGGLDKLHSCIPKGCLVPTLSHGQYDIPAEQLVSIGATLKPTCASGYRLDHESSVTCLDDGQLNRTPECINTSKKYYPMIGIGVGSLVGIIVATLVLCYDRSHLWLTKKN